MKELNRYCYEHYPSENQKLKRFLKKCPIVKRVINRKYWDRAKYYECALFKKFPKIMRKHLRDEKKYSMYLKKNDNKSMLELTKSAKNYVKPILKYYKKRELNCIKKAKIEGDLKECFYQWVI